MHRTLAVFMVFVLVAGCCGPIPGPEPEPDGEVDLAVSCEDFGIISPSYEFYKSMNSLPSFSCTIENRGSGTETVLVTSEVVGHSSVFEQTVVLSPGSMKTVGVQYSFGTAFFELQEATSALLKTKFSVDGEVVRSDSENVQIEKATVFSPELGEEMLIAMWVTYNDPCIEEVISEAKKFAPNGQFIGYMGTPENIDAELAAVFYALYFQDIKYVSSTFTTTNVETAIYQQNIRFPWQSLKYRQMNCIDGAVLYAAILEKLDYETGIAFVPGHSFVVVWDGNESWIPIETTVTGDDISSYWDAVDYGMEYADEPELNIVDVHLAIQEGVTPMPVGAHDCEIKNLDEEAAVYWEIQEELASQEGCADPDYGFIEEGYCTYDNAAYCYEGRVYWAEPGDCGVS